MIEFIVPIIAIGILGLGAWLASRRGGVKPPGPEPTPPPSPELGRLASLSGKVECGLQGIGIHSAVVRLNGLSRTGARFFFDNVKPGTYTLSVNPNDYFHDPTTYTVTLTEGANRFDVVLEWHEYTPYIPGEGDGAITPPVISTHSIQGTVYEYRGDIGDRILLAGAQVKLSCPKPGVAGMTEYVATTGSDGRYSLTDIPYYGGGVMRSWCGLIVSKEGYQVKSTGVDILRTAQVRDITLSPLEGGRGESRFSESDAARFLKTQGLQQ